MNTQDMARQAPSKLYMEARSDAAQISQKLGRRVTLKEYVGVSISMLMSNKDKLKLFEGKEVKK